MSMDKSLRRKNTLSRTRNVLTRSERVEILKSEDKWKADSKPFGLPKVRVLKIGKKSKKAAKAAAEGGDKKEAGKK